MLGFPGPEYSLGVLKLVGNRDLLLEFGAPEQTNPTATPVEAAGMVEGEILLSPG